MCEIFGVSSDRTIDVTRELKEFFKHGEYNPHGWGFVSWNDEGKFTIDKEPVDSTKSTLIDSYLSGGFKCRGLIAHIRKATIGYVDIRNTHPFIAHDPNWREWAFAHNGTIFESNELLPYADIQIGSTDSERILLYILDQNKGVTDEAARFQMMDSVAVKLSDKNKLNFFAFDGQDLYVHKKHSHKKNTCFFIRYIFLKHYKPQYIQRAAYRCKDHKFRKEGKALGQNYLPPRQRQ